MKIAVFENEWSSVQSAFVAANIIHFNDTLEFEVFVSSQALHEFSNITNYDLVLVDLDLSVKSDLDGFSIISKIKEIERSLPIILLTGSSSVKEKLEAHNIDPLPVIVKPVDIDDIFEKISAANPILGVDG